MNEAKMSETVTAYISKSDHISIEVKHDCVEIETSFPKATLSIDDFEELVRKVKLNIRKLKEKQ